MAENVTITTFLELKDNLSAGLSKVETALKKVSGAQTKQTQVEKAQAKAAKEKTKETEKAAKAAEKAAKEKTKEAEKAAKAVAKEAKEKTRALKEEARVKKQLERADRAAAKEREREQRQIERARLGPKVNPAARALEQLKVNQAISRAMLGPGNDPARRSIEQDRIARRMAKAREREQREIARSMQGPRNDPVARMKEQARAQRDISRGMYGPKFNAAERSREIDRARETARRAADAAIKEQQRAAREQERIARRTAKEQERISVRSAARTQDLRSRVGALRGGASAVSGAISGVVTTALGYVSLKRLLGVMDDFEQQTLRVAGTLKAFNMSPTFDAAMYSAKGLYSTLRDMAAKLPGETEDYLTVFSTALPKAIESGLTDVRKIADFTSRYAAVALSSQVDAAQAGRDLFLMLAGRAKSDVKMFTVLSGHIKMATKDFNTLSAAARRSKIEEAIKKYDDQIAAAGGTFNAKLGEAMSRLKEILILGASPLFEGAKSALDTINKYLKENKDVIVRTIKLISIDLLAALKDAGKAFDDINATLQELKFWGELAVGVWIGAKTIAGLTAILDLYLKIKAAAQAIAIAGGAAGVAGGAARGAATAAGGASRYITGMGLLGTTALGVGTFLSPSDTADATLSGGSEQFRTNVNVMQSQGAKYQRLLENNASVLKGIQSSMGVDFGATETSALMGFGPAGSAAQANLEALGRLYKTGPFKREDVLLAAEYFGVDPNEVAQAGGFTPGGGMTSAVAGAGAKGAPKGRQTTINDFRFSKFDIRQEFAEGFDPDRIAVAFASDLAKLGEMRMQSAYAPLFAVRGGA